MRARDVLVPFPTVRPDTAVLEAARLLVAQDLPGLVVVDRAHRPSTILPGTEVLRMAVPLYCQTDPALARVVDEQAADIFVHQLGDRTVAQVLPEQRPELPVVDREATALEMAALMARSCSSLVAVVDDDGCFVGVVTMDALLDAVLVQ